VNETESLPSSSRPPARTPLHTSMPNGSTWRMAAATLASVSRRREKSGRSIASRIRRGWSTSRAPGGAAQLLTASEALPESSQDRVSVPCGGGPPLDRRLAAHMDHLHQPDAGQRAAELRQRAGCELSHSAGGGAQRACCATIRRRILQAGQQNESTPGGMVAAICAMVSSGITPGPLGIAETSPTADAPCATASRGLAGVRDAAHLDPYAHRSPNLSRWNRLAATALNMEGWPA